MEKDGSSKTGQSFDGSRGKQNGAGKTRFPRKSSECGKQGHRARDFPEKNKEESTSDNPLVAIANTAALATDATATDSEEIWVLSSGSASTSPACLGDHEQYRDTRTLRDSSGQLKPGN